MTQILPTVGRTIHWRTANATECRILFVTGLEYGPRAERTAILATDYTEGDSFRVRVYPEDGAWHMYESCDFRGKKFAKSTPR